MNYNLQFFLICLFVRGALSQEPTMLGMIMKECNFSVLYNNSQIENIGNEPEFKECQNWNAITSIKSVEQLSDDNKSNIRCLLYYESLVPICKNVSTLEKLYDLLIHSPPTTFMQDFCGNLISLLQNQSESQTMHSVIKNKEQCEYLCSEYHNGVRVLKEMCVKSYNLQNLGSDMEKNQIPLGGSSNNELEIKKNLKADELTSTFRVKSDQLLSNSNNNQASPTAAKKPEAVVSGSVVSGTHIGIQGDTLAEKPDQHIASGPDSLVGVASEQNKDEQGNNHSETPDINPSKVLLHADELAPSNSNILNSNLKSSTIANDQLPKVQAGQEEKPNIDLDPDNIELDNDQQAPPKLKDPNTAPGDEYDGEQENLEQINEPKKVDTVVEADPEAMPDSYKMPKVSQLSDRFGYDDDVNGNSNFFTYFSFTCVIFIIGYVFYHNKAKVLALLVEGRHSRRPQRARRPNVANYQKLDSNLEEAISSSVSKNPSHVIY